MICRVYKLTSPHTDLVYVGSTVETLNERLRKHRNHYSAGSGCGSCELFKFGEYDVETELLEEIEIEHKYDPKRRKCEQKWMDCTKNKCNILNADHNNALENKEKSKQKSIKYYQEHREDILNYHKEHYLKNKEKVKQQTKQYRLENKEKINQRANEKISCECGFVGSRRNIARHRKSKKHQDYVAAKPKLKIKIIEFKTVE